MSGSYKPLDPGDIALESKSYRIMYDPSGDFSKGAYIGLVEIELMLTAGYFSKGTIFFNVRSGKSYEVIRKRGRLVRVQVGDETPCFEGDAA